MSELKPCPFCSGKATGYPYSWAVKCENCHIQINGISYENAIERWNTRYEPTCTMEKNDKDVIVCSACGQEMDFYDCGCGLEEYQYEHPRCFNCGAKVVSE